MSEDKTSENTHVSEETPRPAFHPDPAAPNLALARITTTSENGAAPANADDEGGGLGTAGTPTSLALGSVIGSIKGEETGEKPTSTEDAGQVKPVPDDRAYTGSLLPASSKVEIEETKYDGGLPNSSVVTVLRPTGTFLETEVESKEEPQERSSPTGGGEEQQPVLSSRESLAAPNPKKTEETQQTIPAALKGPEGHAPTAPLAIPKPVECIAPDGTRESSPRQAEASLSIPTPPIKLAKSQSPAVKIQGGPSSTTGEGGSSTLAASSQPEEVQAETLYSPALKKDSGVASSEHEPVRGHHNVNTDLLQATGKRKSEEDGDSEPPRKRSKDGAPEAVVEQQLPPEGGIGSNSSNQEPAGRAEASPHSAERGERTKNEVDIGGDTTVSATHIASGSVAHRDVPAVDLPADEKNDEVFGEDEPTLSTAGSAAKLITAGPGSANRGIISSGNRVAFSKPQGVLQRGVVAARYDGIGHLQKRKPIAQLGHPPSGTFDDAAAEDLVTSGKSNTNDSKTSAAGSSHQIESPGKSGIFDDAEEDATIGFPSLQAQGGAANSTTSAKDPTPPSPTNLLPQPGTDHVDAKHPPKKQHSKETVKPGKQPKRPLKRALEGLKEKRAADVLLNGKHDLTAVLPLKDCMFLGEKFWIFTVQQLESVLDPSSNREENEDSNPQQIRKAIVMQLTKSSLITDDTDTKVPTEPSSIESHQKDGADETCAPVIEVTSSESVGKTGVNRNSSVPTGVGAGAKDVAQVGRPLEKPQTDQKEAAVEKVLTGQKASSNVMFPPSNPVGKSGDVHGSSVSKGVGAVDKAQGADHAHDSMEERPADKTMVSVVDKVATGQEIASVAESPPNNPVGKSIGIRDFSISNELGEVASGGKAVTSVPGDQHPLDCQTVDRAGAAREIEVMNGEVEWAGKGEVIGQECNSVAEIPSSEPMGKSNEDCDSLIIKCANATQTANGFESSTDGTTTNRGAKPTQQGVRAVRTSVEAAESRLTMWKEMMVAWHKENLPRENTKEKTFLLDGPLSFLFPKTTRYFLASVSVTTLYHFLSLKKSETGSLIAAMQHWRRQCDLPDLSLQALSKHLLGIVNRVETALSRTLHPDSHTRRWMAGSMVVMTGAAKDFLIDYRKYASGTKFLAKRTKDASFELIQWRKEKGMPSLRGTGNVAMISAWKAYVKDELEALKEGGRIVKGINLEAFENYEAVPVTEEKKVLKRRVKRKRPEKTRSPDSKEANRSMVPAAPSEMLKSSTFLAEVLTDDAVVVLRSAGIETAEDLLKADKGEDSLLTQGIVKMRMRANAGESGPGSVQPASCARLACDWTSKVRQKLEESKSPPRGKKRRKLVKPSSERAPAPAHPSEPPRGSAAEDGSVLNSPYDALSAITKSFLRSEGIHSAERFLAARTTDVAKRFVEWRVQNSMPALKGMGAIASVSSWKATVRKAAVQMGMEHLSKKQPPVPLPPKAAKKKPAVSVVPKPVRKEAVEMTHPEALFGLPARKYAVRSSDDDKTLFLFKLSVRKSTLRTSGIGIFVTYEGALQHTGSTDGVDYPLCHNLKPVSQAVTAFPVLSEYPAEISDSMPGWKAVGSSFSAYRRGGGLIDVSKYGVRPFSEGQSEGRLAKLEHCVKSFILNGDTKMDDIQTLASGTRMEKGESVAPPELFSASTHQQNASSDVIAAGGLEMPAKQDPSMPPPSPSEVSEIRPVDQIKKLSKGESFSLSASSSTNVLTRRGNFGDTQHLLFFKQPIERGQTVELNFGALGFSCDDHENTGSDFTRRRYIHEEISSLSLGDLKALTKTVTVTIWAPMTEQLEKMLKGTESGGDSSKMATSRRRLHWIAMRLIAQFEKIDLLRKRNGLAGLQQTEGFVVPTEPFFMLWRTELVRRLWDIPLPPGSRSMGAVLGAEVAREIFAEVSIRGIFSLPLFRSKWCRLAERLFKDIVGVVSSYVSSLGMFCTEHDFVARLGAKTAEYTKLIVALSGIDSASYSMDTMGDITFVRASPASVGSKNDLTPTARFEDSGGIDKITAEKTVSAASSDAPKEEEKGPLGTAPEYGGLQPETTATEVSPKDDELDIPTSAAAMESEEPQNVLAMVDTASKQESDDIKRVPTAPQMISIGEANSICSAVLHKSWYVEKQVLDVIHGVASSAFGLLPKENKGPRLQNLYRTLRAVALNADPSLELPSSPRHESEQVPLTTEQFSGQPTELYQPPSFQVFLGLVWPILRSSGWRLEAGSTPSDVAFIPPGERAIASVQDKLLKQECARKRAKISKDANSTGVGYVPRQTKRLFINAASPKVENVPQEISYRSSLERFLLSLQPSLASDDLKQRAEDVVKAIQECFDDLLPMVVYQGEQDFRPREDFFGCEELMRLLLVLPNLLQQAGLPVGELNNCIAVVKELTGFLSSNLNQLFGEQYQPPHEDHEADGVVMPFLAAALTRAKKKHNTTRADEGETELTEVVLPSDRTDLTDFICLVMDQMIPCRATQEDVRKKNRRIYLGFPGLRCRHCVDVGTEGRYFFTTLESLTTAGTGVEKHIAKCPYVPSEIKAKMVECRSRHHEQRKTMPPGAQGAFFARLWDRLRSLKHSGSSDVYMLPKQESPKPEENSSESQPSIEFRDHLLLLEYLETEEKRNVLEDFSRYYECLAYGGQIYNTSEMPRRFNPEFLLSKYAPPRHVYRGTAG